MFLLSIIFAPLRLMGEILRDLGEHWLDDMSLQREILESGVTRDVHPEKETRYYFRSVLMPLPEEWPRRLLNQLGGQAFLDQKGLDADTSIRDEIRFTPRDFVGERIPVLRRSGDRLCLVVPDVPELKKWFQEVLACQVTPDPEIKERSWEDRFAREIAAALETLAVTAGPGEADTS